MNTLSHTVLGNKSQTEQSKMASDNLSLTPNQYSFLTEPNDSLKCPICLEVAVEPWQHGKCGRLFCRQCLDEYGKEKPCPNCRRKRPDYFEDNKSKREIRDLCVVCDHAHQPCGWEGTLGILEEHAKVCIFVPCPRKCTDGKNIRNITRRELDRHQKEDCPNRDYVCEHCGEKGTYSTITQIHDQVCTKKLVQCPNIKCGQKVERDMVEHHVQMECGYTVISCKYQDLGCDLKLKRHDMLGHEDTEDKMHLHMALDAVVAMKKTVAQLEEKDIIMLKHGESMVLKVTEFSQKKVSNGIFKSPPFYTSANGYFMMIQVHPNGCGYRRGTHVSIYVRILQGKNDGELSWPFVGTLKVQLLNQLEDSDHHVKCIKPALQSFDVDTGTTRGNAKFITHSQLDHDPVKNIQYLKNDTLYLRVSVEVANSKPWLE